MSSSAHTGRGAAEETTEWVGIPAEAELRCPCCCAGCRSRTKQRGRGGGLHSFSRGRKDLVSAARGITQGLSSQYLGNGSRTQPSSVHICQKIRSCLRAGFTVFWNFLCGAEKCSHRQCSMNTRVNAPLKKKKKLNIVFFFFLS